MIFVILFTCLTHQKNTQPNISQLINCTSNPNPKPERHDIDIDLGIQCNVMRDTHLKTSQLKLLSKLNG